MADESNRELYERFTSPLPTTPPAPDESDIVRGLADPDNVEFDRAIEFDTSWGDTAPLGLGNKGEPSENLTEHGYE